jgi:tRNA(Ile)-lysidine synthase
MASSRKSKLNPNPSKRIAVALSGGLDSVVLLDTVCKAASQGRDAAQEIWVFHIHHGLQKAADQWLVFCEKLSKKYQAHFDFRLLHFQNHAAGNIEARARAGRYEALTELCVEHGIEDLLLAHHQNDQAETVLLQLMRGSGVAGLSAMPQERISTLNGHSISLWRPLLGQSKVDLEVYAKLHKLKWIEDPSNQSTVFRRNAIRKQIIPRLKKIQPEAVANLARSAELLAQSQKLLDRLAIQDGKDIFTCQNLQLSTLLSLADRDLPAANNVMRYWLKSNGLSMPSQERLDAWWQDLWGVKPQAHLEWMHDGASIRLWRGLLQLVQIGSGQWVWVEISSGSETPGLSATWVKKAQLAGQIEQRERLGGEKIQIKPNTPRKTLKNLFQEADIPPWERQAPLLFIDGELIAVAGIGVSYSHLTTAGKRVLPEWSYEQ